MRVTTRVTAPNPLVTPNFVSRCYDGQSEIRTRETDCAVYTLSRRVEGKRSMVKRVWSQRLAAHASFIYGASDPLPRTFWRNQRVTANVGRPGSIRLSGSSTVALSFTRLRKAPGTSPRLLPAMLLLLGLAGCFATDDRVQVRAVVVRTEKAPGDLNEGCYALLSNGSTVYHRCAWQVGDTVLARVPAIESDAGGAL